MEFGGPLKRRDETQGGKGQDEEFDRATPFIYELQKGLRTLVFLLRTIQKIVVEVDSAVAA
jgi:hypothetical protein